MLTNGVRKLLLGGLVWLVASGGGLVLVASPAGAATGLTPVTTFGSFAQPNDLAVDQSSGDVFVADVATKTVYIYHRNSSTEYESVGQITGGETPAKAFAFAATEPAPVAVDSTTHAVYVGDLDHHLVDKFELVAPNTYQYACQITGFHAGCHPNLSGEEGTPEPHFGELAGVAVDPHEDLYVSDYEHNAVDEFNSGGADVGQIASPLTSHPSNLAVDSLGNVYLSEFYGPVAKLKVNYLTGEIESEVANFSTGESRAVGVDPSSNAVYLDLFSGASFTDILAYESSGAPFLPTALPPGTSSEGLAVNGSTHEVYVSNKGHEDVAVFAAVVVPDVTRCEAIAVTPNTAILVGEVNPDKTKAEYFFQYGPSIPYGQQTARTLVGVGNEGESFVKVETVVTGLTSGGTYHCRLDATNETNVVNEEGKDGEFTTPIAVVLSTGVPKNVQPTSAKLVGHANPEGKTECYFRYGPTATYGLTTAGQDIGAGAQETEVTAPVALESAATYHYQLVCENSIGTSVGADQAFATPPFPFATETSPHGATLHGTVSPELLITIYHFVYGLTTSYGSSTAEAYTQLNAGESALEQYPVEQLLTALEPGVTYHYALVVTNAAGTTTGLDQTFTTLPESIVEVGTEQPPAVPESPATLILPLTPALLPALVFLRELPVTSTPKSETRAQKLAKALKGCAKQPRRKRAACIKQARKKYGPAKKKRK